MVTSVLKFLGGVVVGSVGGVFAGKYLERVSNEYILDVTSHDKFITFDWVKTTNAFSLCTKEEQDKLLDLLSKLAQARTIEDSDRLSNDIDNFLESITDIISEDGNNDNKEDNTDTIVENENKEGKPGNNDNDNNEVYGKETDRVKSENTEKEMSKEDKSKKAEPSIQSQKNVQVDETPENESKEMADEKAEDDLIEIKDLGKAIDTVTKGCVGKDLINRYVQYIAAIEQSNVDEFFKILTDVSNDVHTQNEESIVRRIYEFADVKSKLKK